MSFNKFDNTIQDFFMLEEMAAARSAFHAMHPALKLILTLVYVVTVISSPRYELSSLCVYFFYPAVVIPLAGIRFAPLMKRLIVALPFVVFAGISNIIFDRQTMLYLFGIGISAGIVSFAVLVLKSLLSVGAVLILAATTPSAEIFAQLRRFRVPRVLVVTVMLCMRYLVLLLSEARYMSVAYHLRSKKQKGIDIRHMGSFLGQLLLRSFERAERIYQAMLCRGYDGSSRFDHAKKPAKRHVAYCMAACGIIIAVRIFPIEYVILTMM